MERRISEVDWKRLRPLKEEALDRFCKRVLSEVAQIAADDATNAHERYLAVVKLIEERDRELAAAFDGLRRSTALVQLARMRALGLIDDPEFSKFNGETRETVATFLQVWRV